jgi:phosphoribosyl 1,2-cyclic phosphodiesterase
LPAPLDQRAVRAKIRAALVAARGRDLDAPGSIDRFLDEELPFSVRATYGGNTSCVEIVGDGDAHLLCDLGSGVREFGNAVLARHGNEAPQRFDVFLSHVHWDHIMGFPFFAPAYLSGNVIRIHGCHAGLRDAFARQQSDPSFPVDFRSLAATIEFVELEPGRSFALGAFSVLPFLQNHGGGSYGYRFSKGGKTIVYSTDSEHKFDALDESYPFLPYFRDADLLIFDAMYSLADQVSVKEDWGHSSNMVAVEIAQLAGVKHLVMFHHEPINDDATLDAVLAETRRYAELCRPRRELTITSAHDGLEIEV